MFLVESLRQLGFGEFQEVGFQGCIMNYNQANSANAFFKIS